MPWSEEENDLFFKIALEGTVFAYIELTELDNIHANNELIYTMQAKVEALERMEHSTILSDRMINRVKFELQMVQSFPDYEIESVDQDSFESFISKTFFNKTVQDFTEFYRASSHMEAGVLLFESRANKNIDLLVEKIKEHLIVNLGFNGNKVIAGEIFNLTVETCFRLLVNYYTLESLKKLNGLKLGVKQELFDEEIRKIRMSDIETLAELF